MPSLLQAMLSETPDDLMRAIFEFDDKCDRPANFATVAEKLLLHGTDFSSFLKAAARFTEVSPVAKIKRIDVTEIFVGLLKKHDALLPWAQASPLALFDVLGLVLDDCPAEKAFAIRRMQPFADRASTFIASGTFCKVYMQCLGKDPRTRLALLPHAETQLPFDRHDNDHAHLPLIRVLPTADEVRSYAKQAPHRPKEPDSKRYDSSQHVVDRQFRLLRDELVSTFLEEIAGPRSRVYDRVRLLTGPAVDAKSGLVSLAVTFRFPAGHRIHALKTPQEKEQFLQRARRMLGDQSLVAICDADGSKRVADRILAVGIVVYPAKDARFLLLRDMPEVTVLLSQPTDYWHLQSKHLTMIGSTVTLFGQQPVLRALQQLHTVPFASVLLRCEAPQPAVARTLDATFDLDMMGARPPALDDGRFNPSQSKAIADALRNDVTLVQGPPGTGKTHVGVEICRQALLSGKKILMLCYTNHALDQFLLRVAAQDGVQSTWLARLGSQVKDEKVLQFVRDLSLTGGGSQWPKHQLRQLHESQERAAEMLRCGIQDGPVIEALGAVHPCLLLGDRELRWWQTKIDAKEKWVPMEQQHGRGGRGRGGGPQRRQPIEPYPLFLWDTFRKPDSRCPSILPYPDDLKAAAKRLFSQPRDDIIATVEAHVTAASQAFQARGLELKLQAIDAQFQQIRADSIAEKLRGAKLVACTTAYAAKNLSLLQQLQFQMVVVEEAAEILEGHILTAIPQLSVQHLVLIGDHMQLPPSVKSYNLTVASNNGFNLDRSLFERLVLSNVPYCALDTQHRMFPLLSSIVRRISYPHLKDATAIQLAAAKPMPGLQAQLLFVDHGFPQTSCDDDETIGCANAGEAMFAAEAVRYLLLQTSVKPSSVVVLTGYLGQVKLLQECLTQLEVPILLNSQTKTELKQAKKPRKAAAADGDDDDDDSSDEAGNDDDQARQAEKLREQERIRERSVRISSIDNFQGEEADYIVASLVRSDKPGWMKERQRVTVLLSRAKKGMLLFGNRAVLEKAQGGVWSDVFALMPCQQGLPIQCRSHKTLRTVASGEALHAASPDGGCHIPCDRTMPCGHECPLMCHSHDPGHTLQQRRCKSNVDKVCPAGHLFHVPCCESAEADDDLAEACTTCALLRAATRKRMRALRTLQDQHATRCAALDAKRQALAQAFEEKMQTHGHALAEAQRQLQMEVEAHAAAARVLDADAFTARAAAQRAIRDLEATIAALQRQAATDLDAMDAEHAQATRAQLQHEADALHAERAEMVRLNVVHAQHDLDRMLGADTALAQRQRRNAQLLANDTAMAALLEQLAVVRASLTADRVVCCICDATVPLTAIRMCPSKHFFCTECFDNLVTSHADLALPTRIKHEGLVPCPGADATKCTCLFTTRFICLFACEAVYDAHVRSVDAVKEKMVLDLVELRAQEAAERAARNDVAMHFDKIVTTLLSKACPRCRAVFANFDGCCALTCHQCGCGFCAWCFADCDRDAHRHVAEQHPVPAMGLFPAGGLRAWEAFHRARARVTVEAYVAREVPDTATQAALLARLQPLLADTQ